MTEELDTQAAHALQGTGCKSCATCPLLRESEVTAQHKAGCYRHGKSGTGHPSRPKLGRWQ